MPAPVEATKTRITSIDILRGIVMLIMAIDHVRDALHKGHPEPTDLATTTPILFATRFITHFCAPAFVFLSGISAFLAGTRRSINEQALFLCKRGIWLLIVEVTVVSLAITLNARWEYIILQVIWAIGGSMIILALLLKLKASPALIGIIGFIIFAGHNIFELVNLGKTAETNWFHLLFSGTGWGGVIQIGPTRVLNIPYPMLPWTGVMLMGYAIGPIYRTSFDATKRKRILLSTGLSALAIFFLFRAFNIYGDPAPWSMQKTPALSIISFFNVTKYPCSMLYLCITLGTALVILSRTENIDNRLTKILTVYGSVPLFYYIIHWYLIQTIAIALFFILGFHINQIILPNNPLWFTPVEFGISLAGVYLVWLIVIVTLYRPCKWFSNYKKTHRQWWLSYL